MPRSQCQMGVRKVHLRVAPARAMRGARLSTHTRPALPLGPPRPAPTSPGPGACPPCARAVTPRALLTPCPAGFPVAAQVLRDQKCYSFSLVYKLVLSPFLTSFQHFRTIYLCRFDIQLSSEMPVCMWGSGRSVPRGLRSSRSLTGFVACYRFIKGFPRVL